MARALADLGRRSRFKCVPVRRAESHVPNLQKIKPAPIEIFLRIGSREHALLEPKCDASRCVELVQIVALPLHPASAPDWVAPVAASGGGGEISWGISQLGSQSKKSGDVVLSSRAKSISKTG